MKKRNIDSSNKMKYYNLMNRAKDWFSQAEEDLLWAKDTLKAKRWAPACFVSQQVAEKSIKALALYEGWDEIRSHSVLEIAEAMKINGEISQIAARLDQYYISTRYPDAFAAGAPYKFFTREQAEEAVDFAQCFLGIIREKINDSAQAK